MVPQVSEPESVLEPMQKCAVPRVHVALASAAWLQMAGVNVNKPRAKTSTTGGIGWKYAAEHQRLAGGGIEVATGGRRAS
jgi:hypothetical protein